MTKTPGPVAHGKMQPKPGSPPGLETDGKGNVIPLAERTEEDREAAGGSVKDPEGDAENPASMPRDQQGQGGKVIDRDAPGAAVSYVAGHGLSWKSLTGRSGTGIAALAPI